MQRRRLWLTLALATVSVLLTGCSLLAQDEPLDADSEQSQEQQAAEASETGLEDDAAVADPVVVADEIQLPPGFAAYRWASGLRQPTALAFSPDGRLFVSEFSGRLLTLRDTDGNGISDERAVFALGLDRPLGFAIESDTRVYVSNRGEIIVADDSDADGEADSVTPIIRRLPVGLHQNNAIALGPDGRLYISLGSTCNDCEEEDAFSASILVFDFETSQLAVYASGLRNAYDLLFKPDGALWATDAGSDAPCPTSDELNRIQAGADYGWPYCGGGDPTVDTSGGAALVLGFRAGARGLAWFESPTYPPDLSGGFYIALTNDASPDAGSAGLVQFAKLQQDGSATLRNFAAGFSQPIAVTVGPDGSLFVADFDRGVIYRIGAPPE